MELVIRTEGNLMVTTVVGKAALNLIDDLLVCGDCVATEFDYVSGKVNGFLMTVDCTYSCGDVKLHLWEGFRLIAHGDSNDRQCS